MDKFQNYDDSMSEEEESSGGPADRNILGSI